MLPRPSPRFGWWPATLGVPYFVPTSLQRPTVSSHGHLPLYLCVPSSSGHQSLELGPTLIQYDFLLTNCICKDPISKYGHIRQLDWNGSFLCGRHSTPLEDGQRMKKTATQSTKHTDNDRQAGASPPQAACGQNRFPPHSSLPRRTAGPASPHLCKNLNCKRETKRCQADTLLAAALLRFFNTPGPGTKSLTMCSQHV